MMGLLAKLWRKLGFSKNIQLFIMRFFQDSFLIGVTGVILNDKNEVLLFKHTYRQIEWSLPGGYIKKGEHPAEALEREIEEESGLVVSADEELKIRTDRTEARLDIGFTGKFIGGEFKPSTEVIDYGFFKEEYLPLISRTQVKLIHEVLKNKAHPISANTGRSKPSFTDKLKNLFKRE